MEDNGNIIVQSNMDNNMEKVDRFLSVYKDHNVIIESFTSCEYLSKELPKFYDIDLTTIDKAI